MKATLALILAIVGCVVSIVTLVLWLVMGNGVPGSGLGGYDFSSAEAALKSRQLIRANTDIRAEMDAAVADGVENRDKRLAQVNSIKVEKTLEEDGNAVVLYTYKTDGEGRERYDADWFKKRKDGRYWPTHVSVAEWRTKGGKKAEIAEEVEKWERKGF